MNMWEYLHAMGERNVTREGRIIPNDFRGWLAFGLFIQSSGLFGMMCLFPKMMESQGFMTLASAIIVTGWVGGAVAFAYSAGKREGEKEAAASLGKALDLAQAATSNTESIEPASGKQGDPVHVVAEEDNRGT